MRLFACTLIVGVMLTMMLVMCQRKEIERMRDAVQASQQMSQIEELCK